MRSILCHKCSETFHLHPEDKANGFKMRKIPITVKCPENLCISVLAGTERTDIPVPHLVCDHCNTDLLDGSKAVAVTMWQEDEPDNWEKGYSAP